MADDLAGMFFGIALVILLRLPEAGGGLNRGGDDLGEIPWRELFFNLLSYLLLFG